VIWHESVVGHRIHLLSDPRTGERRAPLFFASATVDPDLGGRYDLTAPRGACYLADAVATCVLEVAAEDLDATGGMQLLSEMWLRRRRRIELTARRDHEPFADFTAASAFGFGLSGDIHATDDRALTQRWAAAVRRAGMIGVRGHARTPPGGTAATWTLFGDAGPTVTITGYVTSPPATLHQDAELLDELRRYGVEVLPVPNSVRAT
jgi:hypothetical protein